jgi:hypothetical protein
MSQVTSRLLRALINGGGLLLLTYIFFVHSFGGGSVLFMGILAPVVIINENIKIFWGRLFVSLGLWLFCLYCLFRATRKKVSAGKT